MSARSRRRRLCTTSGHWPDDSPRAPSPAIPCNCDRRLIGIRLASTTTPSPFHGWRIPQPSPQKLHRSPAMLPARRPNPPRQGICIEAASGLNFPMRRASIAPPSPQAARVSPHSISLLSVRRVRPPPRFPIASALSRDHLRRRFAPPTCSGSFPGDAPRPSAACSHPCDARIEKPGGLHATFFCPIAPSASISCLFDLPEWSPGTDESPGTHRATLFISLEKTPNWCLSSKEQDQAGSLRREKGAGLVWFAVPFSSVAAGSGLSIGSNFRVAAHQVNQPRSNQMQTMNTHSSCRSSSLATRLSPEAPTSAGVLA